MKKSEFDIIIIGGGATGAGIALDASLRGLSVVLFEQNDFAEGTSSRSTKLVHGGVRYLEAAVKQLNRVQYALVKEGLRERKLFLQNVSHLAHPIELITPLYKWYEIPYVYAGLFLYDMISSKASLGRSKLLSAKNALKKNSSINPKGLKGAVSYYDGTFNDSRMVIALLQSAEVNSAEVYNHHKVISISKRDHEISSITVLDKTNNTKTEYRATVVINATGPFVDTIRHLDNPKATSVIQASSGIHVVVDKRFLPSAQGLMIPQTSDGRVLFVLPYQGKCLIGTSDNPAKLTDQPVATDIEIDYLLANVNGYFNIEVRRSDILATFSGLRPLLLQDRTEDTSQLTREYIEQFSPSGLLTIAGGKWTSYRSMAESAVDLALKKLSKSPKAHPCKTENYKVMGSQARSSEILSALPVEMKYLYNLYGDRSLKVIKIAQEESAMEKLHPDAPNIKAELLYCIRHEYVKKPLDFITRRINIGLTDEKIANEMIPIVSDIIENQKDKT